jgi:hypothetical protein
MGAGDKRADVVDGAGKEAEDAFKFLDGESLIEPKATRRGRCSAGGWLDPLSSLQLSQRNQADISLGLILMCISWYVSWYVNLDLTLKPSAPM